MRFLFRMKTQHKLRNYINQRRRTWFGTNIEKDEEKQHPPKQTYGKSCTSSSRFLERLVNDSRLEGDRVIASRNFDFYNIQTMLCLQARDQKGSLNFIYFFLVFSFGFATSQDRSGVSLRRVLHKVFVLVMFIDSMARKE